jgi:ABC-type dipeptide/oligopeptide/nickel transport system permease subunit
VKENQYVEAVRALGADGAGSSCSTSCPNVLAPFIIMRDAQLGGAILPRRP